jgi:hypothetical protein
MNPAIWGPPMWISLHTITLNYPDKPTSCQEKMIREFFWNLQYVLPCELCRNHYSEMIRTHPPNTKDRKSLVYWLIDRHNQVNERLGKKVYSYDEVLKKYQDLYNIQMKDNKTNAILELSKDDKMGVTCSVDKAEIKEGFIGNSYENIWRNIVIGLGVILIVGLLYRYRKRLIK